MTLDIPVDRTARQLHVAPATVLIGPGVRSRLGAVIKPLGRRVLVIAGHGGWPIVEPEVSAALAAEGIRWEVSLYPPDCTEPAASRAVAAIAAADAEVVLGVGGGKACDLAKLVAEEAGLPVVTLPTSAATCAAWTALGNFYDEDGGFRFGRTLARCPLAVVVDTALIARAPARLLASGLADTLAKWYETAASVRYDEADMGTRAAWRMAKLLHDEILEWGVQAYRDAATGQLTPAVASAIETNICLAGTVGGLGGERCRSVAAHAVHNALTTQPGTRSSWHGEKVGFGILAQLLLEGRTEEAERLGHFFAELELPLTLEQLGFDLSSAALDAVAAHVCRPGSTAHHLPFPVTPASVRAALEATDALGRSLTNVRV